jgi:long-chain acyl-CoA synthetase
MKALEEKDTVAYYVHTLVKEYAHQPAILWKGGFRTEVYSYARLYDTARRVVTLLHSMGIRKGDRVGVWAYNGPAWVAFLLGCSISGVVVVPVDFLSKADFAATILGKAEAKALLLSRVKEVDAPVAKLYAEGLMDTLRTVPPAALSEHPEIEPDDLLEIVFTSGTTGDPKGVMITNRNLVSNIRSMRLVMPLDGSYRFFSVLPLSHLLEQVVGLFYPLRFGATVLYSRTRKPREITRLLNRHRITTIVSVPLFLDVLKSTLLRQAGEKGLGGFLRGLTALNRRLPFGVRRVLTWPVRLGIGKNLKFFIAGGARLSESTEDFWRALGIDVLQGYGLTEASPVVSCNVIGRMKAHSVGVCLPNQEIHIAPDGEILIRGNNITPGYYRHESATRAAFEDSWFRTGDVGETDGDGFLFIRGRKKDMVLTGAGMNIFPQDIEAVLNSLPPVRESCVVGIEEEGKTKVYASIIPEPSVRQPVEDILRQANERLNPHQRISAGGVWPGREFPKTPLMKVKRREVARIVDESMTLEKPPVAREEAEKGVGPDLRDVLANYFRISPREIREESRLAGDLGLDSLGIVELVVLLEEWFRVDFDESSLTPETTFADLRALIESTARSTARFPEGAWARRAPSRALREAFQRFSHLYLRLRLALDVKGAEFLSGLSEPVIFVANHVGYLDTTAILSSLPQELRKRTAVAAAAEIYFGLDRERGERRRPLAPFVSFLAPLLMNAFPFSRKRAIRKSLGLMGELLDDGWSVLLYPEGIRRRTGEMAPFKPGVGLIATEMRAPIVPVKLKGSFEILPRGSSLRDRVEVRFGAPLDFGGAHDHAETARQIEDVLRSL